MPLTPTLPAGRLIEGNGPMHRQDTARQPWMHCRPVWRTLSISLVLILLPIVVTGCGHRQSDVADPRVVASGGTAKPSVTPARRVRVHIVPQSAAAAAGSRTVTPSAPTAAPTTTTPAAVVFRGRSDTNAVALTFDAGADVGYTQLILDVLRRNGIHATFGMTGQWAQDNPQLLKQIVADGHELMNHTWDHTSFTGLSTHTRPLGRPDRFSEIDRTEAIVRELTGATTIPYFRAPFGDRDGSVEADVGLHGYRYDVLWSVDTRGWAGAPPSQIIATSAQGATAGAIYVMHVGAQSQDGPALQSVIDVIRQKGLGFATISQILAGS